MLRAEHDKLPKRRLNFPDPYSWTDHAEITNTYMCYLIAAGNWCEDCTAVNPQSGIEEAMLVNDASDLPRINVDKVIDAHEALKRMGPNFITDMGGENLTIPGYEKVVQSFAKDPILDGLVYSSSMYLLRPDGSPNKLFDKYEEAGLFSGAMYLLASVDHLVGSKDEFPPDADGSYAKAFGGLRLMKWLVDHGHNTAGTLGIHMVIRKNNIDQIMPLYEHAGELGIWFSYCDVVHAPYTTRRRGAVPEAFYRDRLTEEDRPLLEQTLGRIIEEESARLRRGELRTTIPSSAFARMSMTYGPENRLNCRDHREGMLPNTFDVHPSGQMRACIAQDTFEDVQHCSGCAYISIDRGHSDYVPFEMSLFGAKPGDIVWRNAIVNRKHPAFRVDRQNLALVVSDDGSVGPLYDDVEYYNRDQDLSYGSEVTDCREQLTDDRYYKEPRPGDLFSKKEVLFEL